MGGVGRGSGPVEGGAPQGMAGTPPGVPSPGTGRTGTRRSATATTGGGGTPAGPGLGQGPTGPGATAEQPPPPPERPFQDPEPADIPRESGRTPETTGGGRNPHPGVATLIYGLENPSTGDRELAATLPEAQALKDVGWEVRKTFRVWEAGLSWKQDAELMLFCRSCGHLHPGPVCPPRAPMRQTNIPTPSRPQRVQHIRDPEPPMPPPGLGAPGAPATRDPVWYGMEDISTGTGNTRFSTTAPHPTGVYPKPGQGDTSVFRPPGRARRTCPGGQRRPLRRSTSLVFNALAAPVDLQRMLAPMSCMIM